MARLPKSPTEAVALLGVSEGTSVIAVAPSNGFTEALAEVVGDKGSVLVQDPPPDLEAPKQVTVSDSIADDASAQVVCIWVAAAHPHAIRDLSPRVADNGTLWAILPRVGRDEPSPINEADVKRTMLIQGWRGDKTVPLATDAYALRFRKRR